MFGMEEKQKCCRLCYILCAGIILFQKVVFQMIYCIFTLSQMYSSLLQKSCDAFALLKCNNISHYYILLGVI